MFVAALLASAEFSFGAAGGSRGERRADASACATSDDFSLIFGASDFAGPQAQERQEVSLGVKLGLFEAGLRTVPGNAGLARVGGEAGVHFETLRLVLGAQTASLGQAHLDAATARIELEHELADDLRGGLSASAWALQLDARGPNPWLSWGKKTLDWAQKWEAGAWLSRDFEDLFSLAPSLAVAQSAQPGVYEARLSLAVEIPLGPVKLRAEPAVAKQWPAMWLFDVSAGLALSLP